MGQAPHPTWESIANKKPQFGVSPIFSHSVSDPPQVSVIMSVFNGGRYLREALESILTQDGVTLELIVVNDGSTDESTAILAEYALQDKRIRVVDQPNSGLTAALILGCSHAQGEFIARQDADDLSQPRRLEHQVQAMQDHPDVVLVGSWVEDLTPEGVRATIHRNSEFQLTAPDGTQRTLTGVLAHGSVLLRKTAVERVGGYRACFYYAQDGDLWLRLSQIGRFLILPEVLYSRFVTPGSISSRCRQEQTRFTELARLAFFAEEQTRPIETYLAEAESLASACRQTKGRPISGYELATSHLLLSASLRSAQPRLAWHYLWKALKACPFHPATWKAILRQSIGRSCGHENLETQTTVK